MVENRDLLDKIRVSGYTIVSLAKEIPMCRQTLSDKLNGKKEFSLTEIQRLIEILHLSDAETMYFFKLKVKKS